MQYFNNTARKFIKDQDVLKKFYEFRDNLYESLEHRVSFKKNHKLFGKEMGDQFFEDMEKKLVFAKQKYERWGVRTKL